MMPLPNLCERIMEYECDFNFQGVTRAPVAEQKYLMQAEQLSICDSLYTIITSMLPSQADALREWVFVKRFLCPKTRSAFAPRQGRISLPWGALPVFMHFSNK